MAKQNQNNSMKVTRKVYKNKLKIVKKIFLKKKKRKKNVKNTYWNIFKKDKEKIKEHRTRYHNTKAKNNIIKSLFFDVYNIKMNKKVLMITDIGIDKCKFDYSKYPFWHK